MEDTICAISTAAGKGAISIIRVSGSESIAIINSVFSGKDLTKVDSHTIHYGYIVDDKQNKIDEVLVSVMKAPKTFTTEDVVEINCHGGMIITDKVLELLLCHGCRLAEPGEFTKRALLNGRIDTLQAEAVMDMIDAKTNTQRELAINQLSGKISDKINDVRSDLVQIISNINVNMDHPEYDDVEIITNETIKPKLKQIKEKLHTMIEESKSGKIIKEGIKTAIIGEPNVGKSSLLNALLEEEKAIVTDIAGTTRDIVEGQIALNGILLNIIDTAGIRKTDDKIEAIGVEKSKSVLKEADLILLMLNNNETITPEIESLLEEIKEKNFIIIINKSDLESKLDMKKITQFSKNCIKMSLKEKTGIEELKEKIEQEFKIKEMNEKEPTYISSARNVSILKTCLKRIEEVEEAITVNQPIDMIEMDIKYIWEQLGLINGTTYDEELLDEMFKRFCLGK